MPATMPLRAPMFASCGPPIASVNSPVSSPAHARRAERSPRLIHIDLPLARPELAFRLGTFPAKRGRSHCTHFVRRPKKMSDKYAGAARPARPPAEPLPAMSCDCHLHVFGDPAKYRDSNPNPIHASREASWRDALRMHASVGFGRGVLVQPANYRTDHTYLREALARVPRGAYRATG